MKKMPGILLFLILVLVILQIVSLRTLSRAEQRLNTLEKKVEALAAAKPETAPAPVQSSQ